MTTRSDADVARDRLLPYDGTIDLTFLRGTECVRAAKEGGGACEVMADRDSDTVLAVLRKGDVLRRNADGSLSVLSVWP